MPIAKKRFDAHLIAETDSWKTACFWVKRTTIRDNRRRSLLGNGRVIREVTSEAI
jgi:hypothetical protein